VGRSIKKGPFVADKLFKKVVRQKQSGDREPLRTWARSCTVTPDFVGHWFAIHNGRAFIKVLITEDMVGHKLGEFAPTRTFRGHSGNRKAAAAAAATPAAEE